MKKKLFLMCMSMMFLLVSCGGVAEVANTIASDPHGPLVAASIVFQESVEILVELRDGGFFNDQEIEEITELLYYLNDLLIEWNVAIDAGDTSMDYKAAFDECVEYLREYILIGSNRSTV